MRTFRFFFAFITVLAFTTCSNDDTSPPTQQPENLLIKVTNTATVNDDGNDILGINDIITYTISVQNLSNVELTAIDLTSNLEDLLNNNLSLTSGLSFDNSSSNSPLGTLLANETATYTGNYTITQNEVDTGGLSHSVVVNAISPEGITITDTSDNGDDSDGNLEDDPTQTLILINPNIIAEYHILNSVGEIMTKYSFDSMGQIDYISHSFNNVTTIHSFEFDGSEKLINYAKTDDNGFLLESNDITYDSEDRITTIGDRQIEFIEDDPNYFIDSGNFNEDVWIVDNIEYTESYYIKYDYLTPNNPILRSCSYSYTSEYDLNTETLIDEYGGCGDTFWNGFDGNVFNDCSDTDCVLFQHDSNTNPLRSSTNMIEVYNFLRTQLLGFNYDPLFLLFSQNNLVQINYSDPSYIVYTYEFNDNNLPVAGNRQYLDELGPGETHPYSNYYYQGDIIPD